LILPLLAIEFLDELVFGAQGAALPLIRDDLGLDYVQIGFLISLPGIVSCVIEPFLGVLADVWKRRALILGGGIAFALSLLLTSLSSGFSLLLISFILSNPASGAFVILSQATLMDVAPDRHEQNMARWTLSGQLGVMVGPFVVGAVAATGFGWRGLYGGFAILTLALLALAWRLPFDRRSRESSGVGFREGLLNAFRALRRREVLRWLTLLEFSDLLLDVLLGFLALYFTDVVMLTPAQASLAVGVWAGVGLLGDLLLIPLLERVAGLRYMRWSVVAELLLFPCFLLAPWLWAKFVLLALIGLFNAGWYSILKAQLYSAMPGQSGTVMTVGSLFGLVGGLLPLGLGLAAEKLGLQATMWLLLAGPIVISLGLPRPAGRPQVGSEPG
jgi:FSR family fosmidomycin resistance protein-like MFS transporter